MPRPGRRSRTQRRSNNARYIKSFSGEEQRSYGLLDNWMNGSFALPSIHRSINPTIHKSIHPSLRRIIFLILFLFFLPPLAASAQTNDDCLACHSDNSMTVTDSTGAARSLFVDATKMENSVHAGFEATPAVTQISQIPFALSRIFGMTAVGCWAVNL